MLCTACMIMEGNATSYQCIGVYVPFAQYRSQVPTHCSTLEVGL